MSRNGTLEDALKSISDFNKEHRQEQERLHRQQVAANKKNGDYALKEEREKRKKTEREEVKRRKKKRRRRDDSSDDSSEEEEPRSKKKGSDRHDDDSGSGREIRRKKRSEEDSDRRKRKDGERKKERRRKNRRRASSTESSQDEQDEATEVDHDAAMEAAGRVLEVYPDLQSELVQLLTSLDAGQAVDIASIPDAKLRALLEALFITLSLRRSSLGLYLLPERASKSLDVLAPLLKSKPFKNAAAEDRETNGPSEKDQAEEANAPVIGPGLPSNSSVEQKGSDFNKLALGPSSEDAEPKAASAEEGDVNRVEIGPVGPPPAPNKRVIGPAAPPAEVLEAAAKLTEAEEELRSAYEDDDVLIGPPPPAMIAEADNAPEKERFDEVLHILAPTTRDPYTLLRVKADSSASEIKKRYWKVSLLVHPDKCKHPQAQQAFTLLNKAFKEVEDPAKRAVVDAKLAEEQRKAEFAEEMKGLREAAQWRKLRGETQPGDEELLGAAPEEEGRDTWMTELPPERQAGPAVPMQSTYFSTKERTGRGDTSGWTDNPQEKAKKAQQQYLEAYSQAMLGPSVEQTQATEKASATAKVMDQYNSKKRAQTLVEKHQEAMQKEKKKKKKKSGDTKEKEEWEESHPWKPWDREKDLVIGKAVKLDKDSSATALASRFGSTRPGERRFL